MGLIFCFFCAPIVLLLSSSITKPLSAATTPLVNSTTDQDALLALKNTILDPNAILEQNWSSDTFVCHWIGVTCGTKHQRVTGLNISGFALSGTLPPHLGNLTFLRYLDISFNDFRGPIPSELSGLYRLRVIDMGSNSFTGEIPSWFGALTRLELLRLRSNTFSGRIPVEIGNCNSLNLLALNFNHLTGPIPKQIGNCTSLKIVYLSNNNLTGELPQELSNLKFLEIFSVLNNSMSGSIPSFFFNISTMRVLGFSLNQFSGPLHLPRKFSLFNLEKLLLTGNRLSGEIPNSITNASKLNILDLANNSFSGYVPDFGNLRLLQRLNIWDNNLLISGAESFLSSLTNCQVLEVLDISGNPFNGTFPDSIGNLSTSLEIFIVEECNITGAIPSTIGNLSSLLDLFLNGNQLTGSIPLTIGRLKQLQRLYLYRNRLQGYIPFDLCLPSNIGELYLNDNVLTGPIPECLGDVRSLRNVNLGSNKLNSTIPSNFWNLRDLLILNLSSNYLSGQLSSQIASLRVINILDLSHNQLTGGIPSSIDGCQSLGFLSLSNNKLEGSIPPSLGNIRSLITLDLSHNNLSGTIPDSLEGLNLLQYFNVSHNKLEGKIPTGGQFNNFTAQSFLNNSALCGVTRFQVPHCKEKDIRKSRLKKVGQLMKYILPPFILVIILATVIVLGLTTRWKYKRVPPVTTDISVGVTWGRISYMELLRGTNGFNETNLLGRGSFGSVFKATLSDGLIVAVKVFNLESERVVRSFDTECEILSNVRHRNLAGVIGSCSNTEFKALILGYMPNGSLEKWVHSENYCLDLIQRLQIAIDVALALEYLHHGHTFPIVHCDIKPSNVLLDKDMVAHLADFGISKLFEDGESMVQTKTLATIGYAAPEYGSEGKVSTSGDVYSYGILLLEIFTSKKPTDDMFSEEMSLKDWVHKALQDNSVREVVAPDLLPREDQYLCTNLEECVSSSFSLSMKCLAVSPNERINMAEAVVSLQKIKAKVVSWNYKS